MGHLKPSAAGNASEWEGGGGREGGEPASGERRRSGAAVRPAAVQPQPPREPPAPPNCCWSALVLAALATGASWILVLSEFCSHQHEPIPSGEPLSHLFSCVGVLFFFFSLSLSLGSEAFESHLELGARCLAFPSSRSQKEGRAEGESRRC